ncbi:MAG TPA: aspartoacylase [Nostocaceae cyanobacterium]|nr:aspartoacylase [Nostocaceae cyanobacterium]
MNQINQVAIIGGSHGNELTGVFLVKKFQQQPKLITRPSFKTLALLGNTKAIAEGRRYINQDLNRCFHLQYPEDIKTASYEELRAKEIQQTLFPANQPGVDTIIDLHTTTSNMGLSIILGNLHPFLLRLAGYLSLINPLVKIYYHPQPKYSGYLRSLCDLGIVIEVGAVAQGILDAELFQQTEQLVYAILDYFEIENQGKRVEKINNFTIYKFLEMIDYPRNEAGDIQAMIHPRLKFRDFEPLQPGEPIFLTFDGQEIIYEGDFTVYPIFINEAAYYEKGIAMHIAQKQLIQLD